MAPIATPFSADVLALPLRGRNLPAPTLAEIFGKGPTLLALLRHLG